MVCPYYAAESVCAHHGQLPRDCSVGSDIHDLLIQQEQSGHIVVEDYSFLFFRLFNQRLSESYFSLYMLLWGIVGLLSMTELSRVDPRIICQEKKNKLNCCASGSTWLTPDTDTCIFEDGGGWQNEIL